MCDLSPLPVTQGGGAEKSTRVLVSAPPTMENPVEGLSGGS